MGGVSYGDLLFIALVCLLIWGLMALMSRSRKERPSNLPSVPDEGAGEELMRSLLLEARTAAIIGIYAEQDAREVQLLRYLQGAGYTVFPVSEGSRAGTLFESFSSLQDLPQSADLVVIAVGGPSVLQWVRRAVGARAKALWLEEGVVHPEAMQIAREANLRFVMGRSLIGAHRRLFG